MFSYNDMAGFENAVNEANEACTECMRELAWWGLDELPDAPAGLEEFAQAQVVNYSDREELQQDYRSYCRDWQDWREAEAACRAAREELEEAEIEFFRHRQDPWRSRDGAASRLATQELDRHGEEYIDLREEQRHHDEDMPTRYEDIRGI